MSLTVEQALSLKPGHKLRFGDNPEPYTVTEVTPDGKGVRLILTKPDGEMTHARHTDLDVAVPHDKATAKHLGQPVADEPEPEKSEPKREPTPAPKAKDADDKSDGKKAAPRRNRSLRS